MNGTPSSRAAESALAMALLPACGPASSLPPPDFAERTLAEIAADPELADWEIRYRAWWLQEMRRRE